MYRCDVQQEAFKVVGSANALIIHRRVLTDERLRRSGWCGRAVHFLSRGRVPAPSHL